MRARTLFPMFAPDGGGSPPSAAAPGAGTPPAGGGAPAGGTSFDWAATLGEAHATHAPLLQAKGWKSPADALGSYAELEKLVGRDKVVLPAKDAPDEAWNEVYAKLGRPEQPDGYGLKAPDGLPEGVWSDEMAGDFAKAAHAAGLNPKQAQTIAAAFVGAAAQRQATAAAAAAEAGQKAEAALKAEWGGAYAANLDLAKRAVRQFGGKALADELDATGLGNNPQLARAMAAIGKAFGEDRLVAGAPMAGATIEGLKGDKNFMDALQTKTHPGHDEAVRRWEKAHEAAAAARA